MSTVLSVTKIIVFNGKCIPTEVGMLKNLNITDTSK